MLLKAAAFFCSLRRWLPLSDVALQLCSWAIVQPKSRLAILCLPIVDLSGCACGTDCLGVRKSNKGSLPSTESAPLTPEIAGKQGFGQQSHERHMLCSKLEEQKLNRP